MADTVEIKALVGNICHPSEDRMVEIGEVVEVSSDLAAVLTKKQAEIMDGKGKASRGGQMVGQVKSKDGKPATNAKQAKSADEASAGSGDGEGSPF